MIVLSFDHCSFDQLKLSNHSLTGQGGDLQFSHESVVSIVHEQNIICCKTLICRQLFAGLRGGLLANENERKNISNDNFICQKGNWKFYQIALLLSWSH